MLHTETVGGVDDTFQQPIICKLPLVILTYKSETIALLWCTVSGGSKEGTSEGTVRNNCKNISRRMDTPLFPNLSIHMAPLISTGKHPRSDDISLSTCPEALVVSSIAAAKEAGGLLYYPDAQYPSSKDRQGPKDVWGFRGE